MFHREGHNIIIISFFLATISCLLAEFGLSNVSIFKTIIQLLALFQLMIVLQFFRNPKRNTIRNENHIIAPVDGKVVIIEEIYEKEYFKDMRLQVSIFMSPFNVHVTRYCVSGKIKFSKYHPGKYLVAWHPKSSELNERTTIVISNNKFGEILYRQVAGAVARRIINYAQEGISVIQGDDAGFIKFGSRLDMFLPLNTQLDIKLNDLVKGGIQIIGHKN